MPTSLDIAQLAGVSQSTVSRALRGDPQRRDLLQRGAQGLEDAADVGGLQGKAELDAEEAEAHVPDLPEGELRLGARGGAQHRGAWWGKWARAVGFIDGFLAGGAAPCTERGLNKPSFQRRLESSGFKQLPQPSLG